MSDRAVRFREKFENHGREWTAKICFLYEIPETDGQDMMFVQIGNQDGILCSVFKCGFDAVWLCDPATSAIRN